MILQEGQSYKILGWCEAIYIGDKVMAGELQHRFRRTDGFGLYCVIPEFLSHEVKEWMPDEDKVVTRFNHLTRNRGLKGRLPLSEREILAERIHRTMGTWYQQQLGKKIEMTASWEQLEEENKEFYFKLADSVIDALQGEP